MQNLKDDLKDKIYGLMYKQDIRDIVKILTYDYCLNNYIRNVSFSEEEFKGFSLENAIDYDQINKELVINLSVLHSKFISLDNNDAYVYNWMILFRELFMTIEDVRLLKYEDDRTINPETTIKSAYEELKSNESNNNYYSFLDQYKIKMVNKCEPISNPVERIKSVRSYFNTINIFEGLNIKSEAIDMFKKEYDKELLEGYSILDQGTYPLRNIFFKSSYLQGKYFMERYFGRWYSDEGMVALSNATNEVHDLKERLALGYPIESIEYKRVRKNII